MQTNLVQSLRETAEGREADAILRSCVHCGFCLATCPTYQLLGDELDSPRGRIYLMKQVLEGALPTAKTQQHLDRCLTCRACESTCPSGVQYGRLVDIGRHLVEEHVGRSGTSSLVRWALRKLVPNRALFGAAFRLGRVVRPLLPQSLQSKLPDVRPAGPWPAPRHARKMLLLDGCVQPAMAPSINAATARLLDALGISLIRVRSAGCCGAVSHHLSAREEALAQARRNVDAWWPAIRAGAEAVVVTASGCGTMVQEYGHLLGHEVGYVDKALEVSRSFRDVSQVVAAEQSSLAKLLRKSSNSVPTRVAFHSPCSLQHGLKIRGVVESLLTAAGYELTYVPDGHLCCGSAGTYSLLEPELSGRLLANKLSALQSDTPELIATANIGCLTHIQSGSAIPVRHWIELLADRVAPV